MLHIFEVLLEMIPIVTLTNLCRQTASISCPDWAMQSTRLAPRKLLPSCYHPKRCRVAAGGRRCTVTALLRKRSVQAEIGHWTQGGERSSWWTGGPSGFWDRTCSFIVFAELPLFSWTWFWTHRSNRCHKKVRAFFQPSWFELRNGVFRACRLGSTLNVSLGMCWPPNAWKPRRTNENLQLNLWWNWLSQKVEVDPQNG